jgi:molybdate transport system ATP-binding protein
MADEIVVNIEKRFRAGAIIRAEFALNLAAGSAAILFGPSGSGKTTVLRSIAGLERPDLGLIRFRDEVWFDDAQRINLRAESRNVGLLFQEYALFPHLTVQENIEYGLDHQTKSERRRTSAEIMRLFEISDLSDRRPRQISGGQAQRVALARAMAPQPRILLLDEPLGALDLPTRVRLRAELRRLLERIRIPSIVVTHDRTEAISLGQQIVVMIDGNTQQTGSVEEVFRHPVNESVASTVGVETILQGVLVEQKSGLARINVDGIDIMAVERRVLSQGAQVLVCVRAEDVTLQHGRPQMESARNHFTGNIESMESDGAVERITVDCGVRLVSLITRSAREELGLEIGTRITASVKATAVHVIGL